MIDAGGLCHNLLTIDLIFFLFLQCFEPVTLAYDLDYVNFENMKIKREKREEITSNHPTSSRESGAYMLNLSRSKLAIKVSI